MSGEMRDGQAREMLAEACPLHATAIRNGVNRSINSLDAICALTKALTREPWEALQQARHAIASLKEDALGYALDEHGETRWPIRNELLAKIDAAREADDFFGYAYFNDGSGYEWSRNHPVESGEVPDATEIALMTRFQFDCAHPPDPMPGQTAPYGEPFPDDKLWYAFEAWFFRECGRTRRSFFEMFDYPVDELRSTGLQRRALRHWQERLHINTRAAPLAEKESVERGLVENGFAEAIANELICSWDKAKKVSRALLRTMDEGGWKIVCVPKTATVKRPGLHPATGHRDTEEMPEVAAMRFIEQLRADEGDSVCILCNDPEAWDAERQMAIECHGGWTEWNALRFYGESVLQCLAKAVTAREEVSG